MHRSRALLSVSALCAVVAPVWAGVVLDPAYSEVEALLDLRRDGQTPFSYREVAPLGESRDSGRPTLGPVGLVEGQASVSSEVLTANLVRLSVSAYSYSNPSNGDDALGYAYARARVAFEVLDAPERITLTAPSEELAYGVELGQRWLWARVFRIVDANGLLEAVTTLHFREGDGFSASESAVQLPPGRYLVDMVAEAFSEFTGPEFQAGLARSTNAELRLGNPCTRPGDTNGDGQVNFLDLAIVLGNFGDGCPQP